MCGWSAPGGCGQARLAPCTCPGLAQSPVGSRSSWACFEFVIARVAFFFDGVGVLLHVVLRAAVLVAASLACVLVARRLVLEGPGVLG
mmetsp:Transcript_23157/g.51050  ORF Transcript_23157/g.51050 Transcript_23157/m.51050 type:complete len:88 (+) Transcript_23157:47-310(+)